MLLYISVAAMLQVPDRHQDEMTYCTLNFIQVFCSFNAKSEAKCGHKDYHNWFVSYSCSSFVS